jgi:hypothetical protein
MSTENKPGENKPGQPGSGPGNPTTTAQPSPTETQAAKSASSKSKRSGAPTEKPNQALPDRGEKLVSRVQEETSRPTSGSTPQVYRVPGVQYPASSNQLPEDWEEQETIVQKAEREQAERVQKLNDDSADLLTAAGSTSNADVQQLLAARAIAEQNADEDGVRYADAQLSERLNA